MITGERAFHIVEEKPQQQLAIEIADLAETQPESRLRTPPRRGACAESLCKDSSQIGSATFGRIGDASALKSSQTEKGVGCIPQLLRAGQRREAAQPAASEPAKRELAKAGEHQAGRPGAQWVG